MSEPEQKDVAPSAGGKRRRSVWLALLLLLGLGLTTWLISFSCSGGWGALS